MRKHVKSLPVLRGKQIVGMVSRRDLMAMLARSDEDLREAAVRAARALPLRPGLERHRARGRGRAVRGTPRARRPYR
ncbi:hypothetical protein [Nonomuraea helvata]|uniref:CBS domain-containing protein n=1 Tax=Nonomuraea helvata TaxID=37484 RepID=A0ABV5SB93_9ACTN